MDRFEAMRVFAQVVASGSFTQAAHALRLSRATVTQQIKQLEAHLQVRLIHRTTRRLSVTAEGAAYHARVVALLAELEDAEASVSTARGLARGRLRIDVPSPVARLLLIPALPDFFARYPLIELDIGVSDRQVDVIAQGVDCVIRGGELRDGGLVARWLCDLPLALYAAPSYLAHCGVPAHPRELTQAPHHWVGFRGAQGGRLYPVASAGDAQVELHGHCAVTVDDGSACLAAGVAGLGVICLPTYMAAAHVAAGELLPILPQWQLPAMPLHVLFAPNRHANHRLRVFIDWVTQRFQLLP